MKRSIGLFVGMLVVCSLGAQEVLTVEQAVELALTYNTSIARSELNVQTAKENYDFAFRAFYPQIVGNSTLSRLNEEPPEPSGLNLNTFGADLTATLNFTSSIFVEIELARLQYQQSEISLDETERTIENSIRQLYNTVLLLKEQIRIAEISLELEEERADRADIQYEAGLVDEFTRLTARVAASNRVTSLEALRSQYVATLRQLNLAIGNDIYSSIEVVGEIDPDIYMLDSMRIIAELVPLSPELVRLGKSVEIFDTGVTRTATQFLPSLGFSYQTTRTYDNDIFDDLDGLANGDNWSNGGALTVVLSIPLGNLLPGSQTWITLAADERARHDAILQLESRTDEIAIEVQQIADNLVNSARSLATLDLNVERARRALTLADEGYRVGLRQYIEVRDAQNQLDVAEFDLISERSNYIALQLNLQSILGVGPRVLKEYALATP